MSGTYGSTPHEVLVSRALIFEYEQLKTDNEQMRAQFNLLNKVQKENIRLVKTNKELEEQIKLLREENEDLRKKIDELEQKDI